MKTTSDSLPSGPDRWENQKILFCGHAGYFTGEVIITPFAVVVLAAKPVFPHTLQRKNLERAGWHIADWNGGYWRPHGSELVRPGVFVLPRESVTRITAENISKFLP